MPAPVVPGSKFEDFEVPTDFTLEDIANWVKATLLERRVVSVEVSRRDADAKKLVFRVHRRR